MAVAPLQWCLREHPGFMKNSLALDDKTRERAQLCIDKRIYSADESYQP